MRRLRQHGSWCSEQGFTLAEVMIVIAFMGIVLAIATSSWFGVIESRRVDSATNQLAADMRLAHTSATNRLGTAHMIFNRNGNPVTCGGQSADYCLVRSTTSGTQVERRYLPDSNYSTSPPRRLVKLSSPNIALDPSGLTIPGVVGGTTTTIEFKADGSARTLGTTVGDPTITVRTTGDAAATSQSCAASHAKPCYDVTFNSATSRVQIVRP